MFSLSGVESTAEEDRTENPELGPTARDLQTRVWHVDLCFGDTSKVLQSVYVIPALGANKVGSGHGRRSRIV